MTPDLDAGRNTAAILLAPNGARRGLTDHPALPLTKQEIARCAAECQEAGADGIHVHVRDGDGQHLLDAEAYTDVTNAIYQEAGPDFFVQITTEAVGLYTPAQQMAVVRKVRPRGASCALREMVPDPASETQASRFFGECASNNIAVQHILYSPDEVAKLLDLMTRGIIPDDGSTSILCVLGRNDAGEAGQVQAFNAFCMMLGASGIDANATMFCAFGIPETRMLTAALAVGRNVRVGFENNLLNCDGSIAENNTARVQAIDGIRTQLGLTRPNNAEIALAMGMQHSD